MFDFLFSHFMNLAMLEFIDLLRIVVLWNIFPVFTNTLAVLTLSFSKSNFSWSLSRSVERLPRLARWNVSS
jgi:hypothetical protein